MSQPYITLADVAERFPGRNGKRVHVNSVRRWVLVGVRGVKLRADLAGGLWVTTEEWLDQFVSDCTTRAVGHRQPQPPQRNEDHERSMQTLEARWGIHVGK